MHRILLILCFICIGLCQYRYQLSEEMESAFVLTGQTVAEILEKGDSLLVRTSKGINLSKNNGVTWERIDYGKPDRPLRLFIDSKGGLWVSLLTDSLTHEGSNLPAGKGIVYQASPGSAWQYFSQPMDGEHFDETKIVVPIRTEIQNLTYDFAETTDENRVNRKLWIASFAGSLRWLSIDSLSIQGANPKWHIKTPNGEKLNVGDNTSIGLGQRVFALAGAKNQLFVGSANGLYYSSDQGDSFTNYSSKNSELSANFITYLTLNQSTVYINAQIAGKDEISGLNTLSMNGDTVDKWSLSYENNWIYSVSFLDETTLLGAKDGLHVVSSTDSVRIHEFYDNHKERGIYSTRVLGAFAKKRSTYTELWVGTDEGLAHSIDLGKSWNILKSSVTKSSVETYQAFAYPSPYSPQVNGDKLRVSFQQKISGNVTLSIFNFAMEKVFMASEARSVQDAAEMVWDGKNKRGNYVSNGVYFFSIKTPEKTYWNKFTVVN